jgi:hypothetical protein
VCGKGPVNVHPDLIHHSGIWVHTRNANVTPRGTQIQQSNNDNQRGTLRCLRVYERVVVVLVIATLVVLSLQ